MPSYTRGVPLDKTRFVKPVKNSTIAYGWKTKNFSAIAGITEKDVKLLGHKDSTQLKGLKGIFRANRPKPARVKWVASRSRDPKIQLTVSTFCDADALGPALNGGWSLVSTAKTVGGGGGRSRLAVVKTSNTLYAWSMNADDFAAFGASIGVEAAISGAERLNLVRGVSYPRPTVMETIVSNTTTKAEASFSTYVADSKVADLEKIGWKIITQLVPPLEL
ncbi:MAG: hypothetical protein SAJ12_09010 [Jaaginema sp. PMC 1079.18]|nr:hypothetical protein [Jaaginema sp. PMC 1080.18]MEC4851140.1 hypothetical protein [Jaaginema sp. PMC 1079.18]MEC4866379.1 hypothetical protein [Jaaginema sp. PMC 1078.18]